MPVLFIGHGSPMNTIEDNAFHRSWASLAGQLPRPAAILCISAHWESRGVFVSTGERPPTIHDFYGFPKALFEVQYPAPGAPELAARIQSRLSDFGVQPDSRRGFDHGAWSVLAPMYPQADIPLVELSLDTGQPGSFHLELALALDFLREEGVLILASGNIVHNLSLFDFHNPKPLGWANRFNQRIREAVETGDLQTLARPHALGDDGRLAVPTAEHYLPLLYAAGLRRPGEPVAFFNETVLGSISMSSVIVGDY